MHLRTLLALITLALFAGIFGACQPAEEAAESTPREASDEPTPQPAAEPQKASASTTLTPRADKPGLSGTVTFTETAGGGVTIVATIQGAVPGDRGFHIHEIGDCSAEDFTSSGGHFNPTATDHGAPGADPSHFGDLGNITIGEDGTGRLEVTSSDLSIGGGEGNVVGRAVVLHEGTDDLTSQPTGAAGGRVACGVIALDNGTTATATNDVNVQQRESGIESVEEPVNAH